MLAARILGLSLAFLAPSPAHAAAHSGVTIQLMLSSGRNPDNDAKARAAEIRIGDLLGPDSTRQVLPGSVLKFHAPRWSSKIDAANRRTSIDELRTDWGENILIIESADEEIAAAAEGQASGRERAVNAVSLVPTSILDGHAEAGYDGAAAHAAPMPGIPVAGASAASERMSAASLAPASHFLSGVDLSAIDLTVSPCADFYQYSCGGWLAKNPIPSDQSSWGRFSELHKRNQEILKDILEKASAAAAAHDADEKKIGDLYASCMDQDAMEKKGIAPLKPDLARIDRLSSRKGLGAQLGRMQAQGFGGIFGFGSEQDFEDASMMIAAIDQSGLSLPDRDYYLEDAHKDDLKAYEEHVAKMFALAGDAVKESRTEASAVVAVETQLAKISMDEVSRRDPAKTHAKTPLSKFEAATPSFDWKGYFAALGAPKIALVDVNAAPYFAGLDRVLTSTPLAAWKSYLRWQVIHGRATSLTSALDQENFSFWSRRLAGQKEQKPRWKRCTAVVDGVMGEALGRDYVDQAFGGEAKTATLGMVGEIESAMQDDIKGVNWMSPRTQQKALDKLAQVTNKIGYPDKWRDYSKLEISRGDELGNLDRSAVLETKRDLAKIGKPADRKEWGMTPPTVNAYYDPSNNNINFPAGILQQPFYDAKADDAANYGAIGAVEGHELTHGFDDQGHQYDGKGNLNNWWTADDQAAFEARSKGLVDQYSKFVIAKDPGGDPKKDVHVNGALTLGENTADNGGVRLAYAAYQKSREGKPSRVIDGFTPQQRFFLGFGQIWCENQTEQSARLQAFDPHPPSKFRVDASLSNMAEFKQAFSCSPGDAMVNPAPARVW
ncbi:MAG: M13 family metallopeptidase [Elusimicrobiota bacterium]